MKRATIIALTIALGVYMNHKRTPRGIRNNNPLNIRISGDKWLGLVGDDGEFFQFESAEKGIRAAARTLATYRKKYGYDTIATIISRWAPTTENNTQAYIQSTAKRMGISPHQALTKADYPALISAMIYHENGQNPYTHNVIIDGFNQGYNA